MKFIPQITLLPIGQDPDTLSISKVVPVVAPLRQQLNLKVPKKTIKTFDFERQDSMSRKFQAVVVSPSPGKVVLDTPITDSVARIPDIDIYWQSSYLDIPQLTVACYPAAPVDSVSVLTYGNYYGERVSENEISELDSISGVSAPVDVGAKSILNVPVDSFSLGKKTARWVENIVVDKPMVVKRGDMLKPVLHQEWFLSIVILAVAITGLLKLKWSKYLGWVFNSILFFGMVNTLRNERWGVSKTVTIWLGILFYLNSSLFLFEVLSQHHRTLMGYSGWKLLMIIMAFLMILFTAKLITYKFVGWVFGTREAVNGYLFQSTLMSKAYAIFLLPVVVLFPFANDILQQWLFGTGVGIFILLYMMQIGRGIVSNLRDVVSGYYIILYLCALEILPLAILYRVLLF